MDECLNSPHDSAGRYNIADVIQAATPEVLSAASLGMLVSGGHYAVMTPWISADTAGKEVLDAPRIFHERLQHSLQKKGLKPFKLGIHIADHDGKWHPDPAAAFIPNIPLQEALMLAWKFDQWGIVYAGPEVGEGHNVAIYRLDGLQWDAGPYHPERVAWYYFKLRNATASIYGRPTGSPLWDTWNNPALVGSNENKAWNLLRHFIASTDRALMPPPICFEVRCIQFGFMAGWISHGRCKSIPGIREFDSAGKRKEIR